MIYGDDVTHVVTERGVANLLRCRSPQEREAALRAIGGDTDFGKRQSPETGDSLRRRGHGDVPLRPRIDVNTATRDWLAAQTIDDLVTASGGLYVPPAKFRPTRSPRLRIGGNYDPEHANSSGLSNSKPAPVDRVKQLAAILLSERSEASGAQVARELHHVLRASIGRPAQLPALSCDGVSARTKRHCAPRRNAISPTARRRPRPRSRRPPIRPARIAAANEHGARGTGALIVIRSEINARLRGEPELKLLDADLRHLFASWFNRGFLELRRIDWQTPAAVLEKLIAYEAVHEIKGWDDLRRRLAPDRRCFAFFHPALPGEPLIFVEVALVEGLPRPCRPCCRRTRMRPPHGRALRADTAIFYSISNCQDGLRGVSFGNFLIKQVVEELQAEFPQLKRFSTCRRCRASGAGSCSGLRKEAIPTPHCCPNSSATAGA